MPDAPDPPAADLPAVSDAARAAFRLNLTAWYRRVRRDLPWRRVRDPYRIWISEVMLQQTRVDQMTPYYERFLAALPTIEDLAAASEDEVLKAWEGLGYYSRARNLHRAAQIVAGDFGGQVPRDYADFRALPGVGPYTAAAVLSIAFGQPYAVVDGNVLRVLARAFGWEVPVNRPAVRARFQLLADELLPPADAGDYNQAVMELGATVCTPRNPRCPSCPLKKVCVARAQKRQHALPVKEKKKPRPHHHVSVALLTRDDGRFLIQRRPSRALLGGLWELPGGKREQGETDAQACARELREELGVEARVGERVARADHAYSHFTVTVTAFACRVARGEPQTELETRWIALEERDAYAFPKANHKLFAQIEARRTAPTLFE